MKILIDLQAVQGESRFRGIGRYSHSLAQALAKRGALRGHEVHLLLKAGFSATVPWIREAFDCVLPQQHIHIVSLLSNTAEMVPSNVWRTRAAEHERERFISNLRPDVVHLSSLFEGWLDDTVTSVKAMSQGTPMAVTLYDLIPLVMADIYLQDPRYRAYYYQKLESLKRSDLLLAISEHSRKEAIELLGMSPDRVVNISGAIDSLFKPQKLTAVATEVLYRKYSISRPFLLYVPGGFDPRKNFDRLIEAFAKLPDNIRRTHQLVIASKLPGGVAAEFQAKSAKLGLAPDEVVLTDYVEDADLIGLYSQCKLYVFPSLHEGLGLPALEAMACGAPVIGSNRSSIPEVIGRQDALFDPYSVPGISALIEKGLTDAAFERTLRRHSIKQAKKFSWERSADLALDAYEAIFEARPKIAKPIPLSASQISRVASRITSQINLGEESLVPEVNDAAALKACILANAAVTQGQQFLVDISELVNRDAKSGIQRVVRSILLELLKHPPPGMQVQAVYSKDGSGLLYARRFTQNFLDKPKKEEQDDPVTFAPGDVFLGLDLTAHLFPAFGKTLSQMRSAGVAIHYVVYDLTPLVNTKWHTTGMTQAFTHWIDALGQYAHSLVCISRAVAKDVRLWFKSHPPVLGAKLRISAFHLGADIKSSQPSKGLPATAARVLGEFRQRPTFLMVGTIEPRKGYRQAIDAFELLWQSKIDVNLVIVGKAGWNVDELLDHIRKHHALEHRLFWLEGISDEYLQKVYRASSALLATSEAEGFGLPLIEAAQQHLPIIARNLPVFKEVAGNHAFYFSGTVPKGLANTIRRWLALKQSGQVVDTAGMAWLTWAESTKNLSECIGFPR